MAWQGSTTWGAGPWSFADANKYIRDNMVSIRRYQNSSNFWSDVVTATNSLTVYGAHTNLASTTPDEATNLLVIVSVCCYGVAGGATTLNIGLFDQAGNSISGSINPTTPVAIVGKELFCIIGKNIAGSGTNPGFNTKLQTNVGTASVILNSVAILQPQN